MDLFVTVLNFDVLKTTKRYMGQWTVNIPQSKLRYQRGEKWIISIGNVITSANVCRVMWLYLFFLSIGSNVQDKNKNNWTVLELESDHILVL